MASNPDRVRVARLVEHGRPIVVEEVTLPEPATDEVLIEIVDDIFLPLVTTG